MFNTEVAAGSLAGIHDWILTSPTITPRTGVGTALRLLHEHGLPALPVVESSQLLGLVFEKDLLRLAPSEATTLDVYELHTALDRLTVARVIKPVEPLRSNASLQEAMSLMARTALEALPVVEEGHVVGLLVWSALLKSLTSPQASLCLERAACADPCFA